jgi:hypothetical protein
VPGRFKTDKIVGHVGIYMGNNQMIHASPKPKDGVQITNINQPYWKKTFLSAKRLDMEYTCGKGAWRKVRSIWVMGEPSQYDPDSSDHPASVRTTKTHPAIQPFAKLRT